MLDLSKKRELKIEFIAENGNKFEHKGTITTRLLDIRKAFLIDAQMKGRDLTDIAESIKMVFEIRPKLFEAFFGETLTMFETMAKGNESIVYDYVANQILNYMEELEEDLFEENKEKQKSKKGK